MTSSVIGCKRTHLIKIDHLNDADSVEHSLLLIKGHLQPACSSAANQLKATLKLQRDTDIAVTTTQEQLTQLSPSGDFKLLFDLSSGHDKSASCQLELRCCSADKQLSFNYNPRTSDYRVQPLYIVCGTTTAPNTVQQQQQQQPNEEREHKERCALIDLNLRLVQCIYAHKLHAAGFANRTFTLNGPCRVFNSQLSCAAARQSSEDELWQLFATEILASAVWGQQLELKFVAFIGCTTYDGAAIGASGGDYSYANIRRHLRAHAALGGGGLALFGSAHFYSWPKRFTDIGDCIRSGERVDLTRQPDESNYRRTYGGVYASTLGAVCHELGHCFDLGHTVDGVMGRGFDYLNRVFTVDQQTEHLPKRIVHPSSSSASSTPAATTTTLTEQSRPRPRLTQIKLKQQQPGSQLLDNYHEQRINDRFYFTRNCAIILAQHRWLQPNCTRTTDSSNYSTAQLDIHLEESSTSIVSSVALRLIELRCNRNSLVAHYEEFAETKKVHRFQLTTSLWDLLATQRSHYVFVLTIEGDTKRLAFEAAPISVN